jgi:hypothetical protein
VSGARGQGGVHALGAAVVEGELGEVGPAAAPATGEDAGARRVGGARKADQDAVEEVIWEVVMRSTPPPRQPSTTTFP